MKKRFYLFATVCLGLPAMALSQKQLSLSVFAGSGISYFGGSGATDHSVYHRNGLSFPYGVDTMSQPYGKKPLANFVAGLQADMSLPGKWVLMINAQYEHTGGRLTGDSVISPSASFKTNGEYRRYYDFIAVNPRVGRVLFQKRVKITVHTGIDYTSKLATGNNFDFTEPGGQKNSIGQSGGEPEVNDCRLTLGASIARKKWSVDINYKHGLTNYLRYGTGKVYARIIQFRWQYSFLQRHS